MAALVKNASTRHRAACTGLRTVITRAAGHHQHRREEVEDDLLEHDGAYRYADSADRSRAICSS